MPKIHAGKQADCQACMLLACKACHQPFTISTAPHLPEDFCSHYCERRGEQPRIDRSCVRQRGKYQR